MKVETADAEGWRAPARTQAKLSSTEMRNPNER
jgi:hypothetical protein